MNLDHTGLAGQFCLRHITSYEGVRPEVPGGGR